MCHRTQELIASLILQVTTGMAVTMTAEAQRDQTYFRNNEVH